MGNFLQVHTSGSNLYADNIFANLNDNSDTSLKVVTYDENSNKFFITGTYQGAGTPTTFPGSYNGNMDLTVSDGSTDAREITIGKDRNNSGNARINFQTSDGTYGLQIQRTAGVNADTTFTHTGSADLVMNIKTTGAAFVIKSGSTDLFRVNTSGHVFAPKLNVNSTSTNQLYFNTGTGEIFYVLGNSTKRIKKNIQPLNSSDLNNFDKLRPVSFVYKNDLTNTPVGGFIAEEVAEINPLLAKYGDNYEYTFDETGSCSTTLIDDSQVPVDISDTALLALIVAKIKELDKKIEQLNKLKQ